ncbi:uncharacterized protein LOC100883245 isoform X1 [Megachile rotundata]|uniref:uncharacterized protein LOC100883245 isoform X1 n=1 Tax=Megachile rotundata TaxID=143995 RepID=UPI003FD127DC
MIPVGHIWTKCLVQMHVRPSALIFMLKKRWYESNSGEYNRQQILTHTSIFVEEGLVIQEVPLIVRKINNIEAICNDKNQHSTSIVKTDYKFPDAPKKNNQVTIHNKNESKLQSNSKIKNKLLGRRINIETDEGTAILFCSDFNSFKEVDIEKALQELQSFNTADNLYSMLENKITQEINCRVALEGLKKIIELENNWAKQKSNKMQKHRRMEADTTARDIVMKQLIKLIIGSNDTETILQGLIVLKKDKVSPSRNICRDWICDEALSRATDGEFSPAQLINLIKILSCFKDTKYHALIDTLWVGIVLRQDDINAHTLVALFKSLKYFNQSKSMVKLILERKLSTYWLKLTGTQIAEILNCFYDDISAMNCLLSASKWAELNMNTSTERDVINFICSLNAKDYIDDKIEYSLQDYLKSKILQIENSKLIATIMNYCKNLQVRNEYIMSECGKYFLKHAMSIPTPLLSSILTPFGFLYIKLPNSIEFWKTFDDVLSVKFRDLKLDDALDILLSCTYLERYPMKFFDKIFISQLFHKFYLKSHTVSFNHIKNKLKLLDATMFLECKDYQTMHFPVGKIEKPLFLDARIRRSINVIYEPLASLIGGDKKLSKNVILNQLPIINFYVLDILIHPHVVSNSVFHLNLEQKKNVNTAVLIYLPEYYCRNTRHVIGPQIMRKRQIKKLGFRVMILDYITLQELWNQSNKLSTYLLECLHSAEDAL